jgi:DMSO/TMAO reductase YedYZ molybdopterin-dependent catalytic subunit/thiosulfate reductase cytochrome b subunit
MDALAAAPAFTFPVWVRATHVLNIIFISLLMRSGLQILSSLPKLYWNEDCTPGKEWLRLTRKQMPADRLWISLDEEEEFPALIALPGGRRLGLGRHWHFATALAWVLTGAAYVVLLFVTPEWRTLVPTSWSVFPGAWHAFLTYVSLHLPAPPQGQIYNPLQQLTYFAIVFLVAPLTIATGAAMSPALIGRFPRYVRMFGGKQGARSIHFLCLLVFVAFTVVHTAMVVAHGLPRELASILLGSDRESHGLAVALAIVALAVIFFIHVVATVVSRRAPRTTQHALGAVVDPLQRGLSRMLVSRQHYADSDRSPFFRVNGYPPRDGDYRRLAMGGFRNWRLTVSGLVAEPLDLSLDELRHMEWQEQVTKHNCIQGWTAIASWAGVPVSVLMARCRPLPSARYAVFYAFDDKAQTATEGEPHEGQFYEAIDLQLARHPQTILAYEMNGQPLRVEHGAPLRLRIEVQLGFKMVKWIRAIELVEDYSLIGKGQGGWREDYVYYSQAVAI